MKLVVTERAEKDLLSMEPKQRQRIQAGIDRMLTNPQTADLKKLRAHGEMWRLRIGDWRVILELDLENQTAYALRIKHRKEAYR